MPVNKFWSFAPETAKRKQAAALWAQTITADDPLFAPNQPSASGIAPPPPATNSVATLEPPPVSPPPAAPQQSVLAPAQPPPVPQQAIQPAPAPAPPVVAPTPAVVAPTPPPPVPTPVQRRPPPRVQPIVSPMGDQGQPVMQPLPSQQLAQQTVPVTSQPADSQRTMSGQNGQSAAIPAGDGAPLVTPDTLDTSSRESTVAGIEPLARQYEQMYGIPASVLIAFNIHEGGSGVWAAPFGIKGRSPQGGSSQQATREVLGGKDVYLPSETFSSYGSLNDAYAHFIELVSDPEWVYKGSWDRFQQDGDWRSFIHNIQADGYATDPNWATSILGFAEQQIAPLLGAAPEAESSSLGRVAKSPVPSSGAPIQQQMRPGPSIAPAVFVSPQARDAWYKDQEARVIGSKVQERVIAQGAIPDGARPNDTRVGRQTNGIAMVLNQGAQDNYSSANDFWKWKAAACSAASLAYYLNANGGSYNISDALLLIEDSGPGTDISPSSGLTNVRGAGVSLADAATQRGIDSQARPMDRQTLAALLQGGQPVMLQGSNWGPGGHWFVGTGLKADGSGITIADSGYGRTELSWSELNNYWSGVGVSAMQQRAAFGIAAVTRNLPSARPKSATVEVVPVTPSNGLAEQRAGERSAGVRPPAVTPGGIAPRPAVRVLPHADPLVPPPSRNAQRETALQPLRQDVGRYVGGVQTGRQMLDEGLQDWERQGALGEQRAGEQQAGVRPRVQPLTELGTDRRRYRDPSLTELAADPIQYQGLTELGAPVQGDPMRPWSEQRRRVEGDPVTSHLGVARDVLSMSNPLTDPLGIAKDPLKAIDLIDRPARAVRVATEESMSQPGIEFGVGPLSTKVASDPLAVLDAMRAGLTGERNAYFDQMIVQRVPQMAEPMTRGQLKTILRSTVGAQMTPQMVDEMVTKIEDTVGLPTYAQVAGLMLDVVADPLNVLAEPALILKIGKAVPKLGRALSVARALDFAPPPGASGRVLPGRMAGVSSADFLDPRAVAGAEDAAAVPSTAVDDIGWAPPPNLQRAFNDRRVSDAWEMTQDEFRTMRGQLTLGEGRSEIDRIARALHANTDLPTALRQYGQDFAQENPGLVRRFGNVKSGDTVTVYRAADRMDPNGIRPGDWVALERRYAVQHGAAGYEQGSKIVSTKVKARDVTWAGTSADEWIYAPESVRSGKGVHEHLVQRALANGDPVPPNVLKDYPDLQPPASTANLQPTPPRMPTPDALPDPAAAARQAPASGSQAAATPIDWAAATPDVVDARYPIAAERVSGLTVRPDVPNEGSIAASLDDYDVLPGIREVPFSDLNGLFSKTKRSIALADRIRSSGEINPLIVVIDAEGPYILEGANRFDALQIMGQKTFPALVVVERRAADVAENVAAQAPAPRAAEQAASDAGVPSRRMYSGTGEAFGSPNPAKFNPNGADGPAYYMTNNPEAASAVALGDSRPYLDPATHAGPNVRAIDVPTNARLYDPAFDSPPYDQLVRQTGSKAAANRVLAEMGYDGIGPRDWATRSGNATVAIFPESLPKIRNALSGKQGGQINVGYAANLAGGAAGAGTGYLTAPEGTPEAEKLLRGALGFAAGLALVGGGSVAARRLVGRPRPYNTARAPEIASILESWNTVRPKSWLQETREGLADLPTRIEERLLDDYVRGNKLGTEARVASGVTDPLKTPENIDVEAALALFRGRSATGVQWAEDGLTPVYQQLRSQDEVADLNGLLKLKRDVEVGKLRVSRGANPHALKFSGGVGSLLDAEQRLALMEHRVGPVAWARYQAAETAYRAHMNSILDAKVDVGILSRQFADDLKATHPNYSPGLLAELDTQVGALGGKSLRVDANGIKRLSELGHEAADLEPLTAATILTLRESNRIVRNRAVRTIANALQIAPSTKNVVKRVPNIKLTSGAVTAIQGQAAPPAGTIGTVATHRPPDIAGAIHYWDEGELRYLAVPPEYEKFVKPILADPEALNPVLVIAERLNAFSRMAITQRNPIFPVINAMADLVPALAGGVNPLELARGYAKAFGADQTAVKRFLRAGGGQSGWYGQGRQVPDKIAEGLQRELLDSGGLLVQNTRDLGKLAWNMATLKPVEWYGSKIELATRLAAVEHAAKAGATPMRQTLAGRRVSLDFARAGTWVRPANSVVLFLNAFTQGTAQLGRLARDSTTARWMAGALGGLGVLGYEYNRQFKRSDGAPFYSDIPEYVRDTNFVFILPGTEYVDEQGKERIRYLSYPLRQFGLFVSPFAYAAAKFHGEDPRGYVEFVGGLAGRTLSPFQGPDASGVVSSVVPFGMSTLIQTGFNKDAYRGFDIVPRGLQSLPNEQQYREGRTTKTARDIAGAIGQSPLKTEFAIGDVGGLASQALVVSDLLQGVPGASKRLADLTFGRIVRDRGGQVEQRQGDQYDAMIKQAQDSNIAALKQGPEWAAATTKEDQDALIRKVMGATETILQATSPDAVPDWAKADAPEKVGSQPLTPEQQAEFGQASGDAEQAAIERLMATPEYQQSSITDQATMIRERRSAAKSRTGEEMYPDSDRDPGEPVKWTPAASIKGTGPTAQALRAKYDNDPEGFVRDVEAAVETMKARNAEVKAYQKAKADAEAAGLPLPKPPVIPENIDELQALAGIGNRESAQTPEWTQWNETKKQTQQREKAFREG